MWSGQLYSPPSPVHYAEVNLSRGKGVQLLVMSCCSWFKLTNESLPGKFCLLVCNNIILGYKFMLSYTVEGVKGLAGQTRMDDNDSYAAELSSGP